MRFTDGNGNVTVELGPHGYCHSGWCTATVGDYFCNGRPMWRKYLFPEEELVEYHGPLFDIPDANLPAGYTYMPNGHLGGIDIGGVKGPDGEVYFWA